MSLNTDIFYQHLSATINRVWLYYQHPIKTTPCRNPATTSQTTPIILATNFQYNSTPTTPHISTNPSNIQYQCTAHISLIHVTNSHVRLVQPRPNIRSHSAFLEQKKAFALKKKKFNSHQCGRRDVSWKRSIHFKRLSINRHLVLLK